MKSALKLACLELLRRWKGPSDDNDDESEDEDELSQEASIDMELEREEVRTHLATFHACGWIKQYSRELMEAVHQEIDNHVKSTCKGEFESKLLPSLQQWLQEVLLPFVKMINYSPSEDQEVLSANTLAAVLANDTPQHHDINDALEEALWPSLAMSLLRSFALLRATELFDIIMEFPESMAAAKEFRDAVAASDCLGAVGKIFRPVITRRLLHVGASTSQILDMYVSMIKTLRVVDGSDHLLTFVTLPVRAYLLTRKDTVRCVVQALLEGKGSDLHGELRRGRSLEYGPDEDDEDAGAGVNWQPRKKQRDLHMTAADSKGQQQQGGLDVLALLISIYGSTDLFVKDYRAVLADKLAANLSYRADHEVATLELLKIRFGEAALHSCEVMLKDLEDSRRLNTAITQAMQNKNSNNAAAASGKDGGGDGDDGADKECWLDCAVVSEFYWPSLPDDVFKLHPAVEKQVNRYFDTYKELKKPRELTLMPCGGSVQLDLDFEDGSRRNFVCSPLQATVMLHVADMCSSSSSDEGAVATAERIATLCELEEDEIAAPLGYWVTRGVVKSTKNTNTGVVELAVVETQAERAAADAKKKSKEVAEEGSSSAGAASGSGDEDARSSGDEDDSALMDEDDDDEHDQQMAATAMAAAADKAALALYRQYVVNIVTSHGNMTLDRIHTMLKLLASGDNGGTEAKFDMSMLQLKRFLQTLVDSDTLVDDDGNYSLHK
jgi:anaphase-promoting complex subunit 2